MTAAELKAWRAARGYSQPRAARLIGVGLTTYCAWEQGVTRVPTPVARLLAAWERLRDWGEETP